MLGVMFVCKTATRDGGDNGVVVPSNIISNVASHFHLALFI